MDVPADIEALVREARAVRDRAYAPYSGYRVGAALRAEDGRVFTGANVENGAYPTCVCAETNALGSAVSAGARRFSAIAVVTELDERGRPGTPCGNCRQALSEFGLDTRVVLAGPSGDVVAVLELSALLPWAFTPEHLDG